MASCARRSRSITAAQHDEKIMLTHRFAYSPQLDMRGYERGFLKQAKS
jgi:hypothetical protein